MSECPSCGNPALRVDVGMVGWLPKNDWIEGIPEGAVDCCIAAFGFTDMTPVGGIMLGWHDTMITEDDVKKRDIEKLDGDTQ